MKIWHDIVGPGFGPWIRKVCIILVIFLFFAGCIFGLDRLFALAFQELAQ